MTSLLRPSLVNDRWGDPGVYVDILWERRAVLFDLGDLSALPPRRLLKLSDVFVSHAHMDHFIGFDQLLRYRIAHDPPFRLFGPRGILDRVCAKLAGYTWNIVDAYPLAMEIIEIDETGLTRARMTARDSFRPGERARENRESPRLSYTILDQAALRAEAVVLDHHIPCAAYAVMENRHVNIDPCALDQIGLRRGSWLRRLKEAIRDDEPDDTAIAVDERVRLPLGELRRAVVSVTPGQKVAYVVDAGFTRSNVERILVIARNADVFFCEAPFLERDRDRAAATRHLTALQAGWLARQAGVKRLEVFHFSPRYAEEPDALFAEARGAFEGQDGAATPLIAE